MTEADPARSPGPTDPGSADHAPGDELDTRSELDDLDPDDSDIVAGGPPDEEDPAAFDDGSAGEELDGAGLDEVLGPVDEDAGPLDDDAGPLNDEYDQTVAMEDSPEIEEQNEAREEEALSTDSLRPEDETTEYEPPFRPSTPTAEGETPAEAREGESLDERLAQEEPDAGEPDERG